MSPANDIRGTSTPDPDGDAIFKCSDQNNNTTTSFRVSSKVLRLASPVFVGMLGPSFQEGQKLLQGEVPIIELKDDDAPFMGIIFNVLHYRSGVENHAMSAERLARLAIHCDKYDCANALRPWISVWFKNVERMSQPPTEFGYTLLAAYMFNDSENFSKTSETCLRELNPEFSATWEEQEILTLLPARLSCKMRETATQENCS